ncbi:beta-1,4 N-acetylgalactosaminyltransferase 2-like [Trematomus bernacchii]|uniref:beta-1,4 N-acetylgalactosaminyltransferase 2-like n=1 Tax=Trematomus bernacchii TaxID=40690 RepID=UPI001469A75D|nr:beta-1,4 N-acetylgalactosaminyltransferase 2-like [Trematomus bernacchii]
MAVFIRAPLLAALVFVTCVFIYYYTFSVEFSSHIVSNRDCPSKTKRLPPPLPPSHLPSPGPCTCANGSMLLKNLVPKNQAVELIKRREKEFQQHKARTESVLSTRLYAPSNSPLQYPIQGFKVRPMTPTFIPGLAVHAEQRKNYTVSLKVSKGVLSTTIPAARAKVQGNGESRLMVESSSLETLNELLANVSYTSTVYHIHTGDLASFQFEDHEAVFPITIKQPQPPVLYDMGTDINSQVTITTKTFLRYPQLKVLLKSIRQFYKDIEVIIADDSFVTENITGDHIQHYIMPPGKGWFAGRNLAVSQVTTKYILWVDDDFLFTKWTKIEEMVKVMEAVPELDVLGGKVGKDQFYSSLIYEEGDEMEGGCMYRKSRGKFHSLPGYPECSLVSGVVNFFLARTDAVQRVRFDPKLKRVAHSEFFMDGLGSLMVATCGHVAIGHQKRRKQKGYMRFRQPAKSDTISKLQLHFFKNHLKCIRYG